MKTRQSISILLIGMLLSLWMLYPGAGVTAQDTPPDHHSAALNPPHSTLPVLPETQSVSKAPYAPTTEWIYHKTGDGAHPDGNEQAMVWLMNRARADPTQEGIWLATSTDPNIAGGRTYFGVDTALLQQEFAGYDANPPAAFDRRLYNAAEAHSQYLISVDDQNHDGQFQRITDAGFSYANARGSVFVWADNPVYAHAAFNIDWGNSPPDGMQDSRGHRKAIMSIDGDYTNVGIAMVFEDNDETSVGPLVTTGNYCKANTSSADHYNRFLVGTVWNDTDADEIYDPGEGIAGVTVMPDAGTYYAVTSNSGGYAIPITAPGTYNVTFSGAASAVKSVTVGDDSELLDLNTAATTPTNAAPNVPSAPHPSHGATGIATTTALSWSGGDPDSGDSVTYTVAFGTNNPPPVMDSNVTTTGYNPGSLITGTLYYWQITATDGLSTTTGPVWSFTTTSGETYAVYLPLVIRNPSSSQDNTRLIVFEAFLSTDCYYCQTVAPVIDDQLVPEYAGRPVLFLEHDVQLGYTDPRQSRWWDGWAIGGYVGYPMVMTDSGDQVAERLTNGTDFYNLYKSMVDSALAVPEGQAEIQANVECTGDTVAFTINVTNLGSVTLGASNKATIWVLLYEQSDSGPVSGRLTQRYVHDKASATISTDLVTDASSTYVLTIDSLSGVDWSKMHAVIILDYKPDPSARPYDTYQAIAVDIP
ncbi:MAG: hypothetical protein JXA33_06980 [Anaerolineae bacterium]|nr:hypothetical protein [Anaerolineae bacterium]